MTTDKKIADLQKQIDRLRKQVDDMSEMITMQTQAIARLATGAGGRP